ncbi:PROPROTEIN CONVERTASE SUBTILISIN/KEXIN [Salix koriyanagi]|uniref:PROPROTEIN CONVERTASE SUBTILISIN/KEXIN n=1 Tax=Salix koriyanagi TaxID=2511006 RepID=A0A9Q0QL37_9ROSI|nr:PROPROTEIN CONVERTASE SUBTILISIN/KEXIN [Salix koriyanagi]
MEFIFVYMGAAAENGSLKNDHTQLPGSLLRRRKNALVHSYKHGISGFAARLAAPEAQPIAKKHGVLSVFPDPVHHPHTTRSWDFLKYETDLEINLSPNSDWNLFSQGSDTIVGSLDSGIWPESESFNAKDMSPIPSRWKGACAKAHDLFHLKFEYKTSKISYIDPDDIADGLPNTPSDTMGHGTHVASTASGTMVPGGSYYGLAIN